MNYHKSGNSNSRIGATDQLGVFPKLANNEDINIKYLIEESVREMDF